MIPQIEKAFGFKLYDWQREYLLGKKQFRSGGRRNGNTFAYCLKLLLADREPIELSTLHTYADESHGNRYPKWFANYCYEINDTLVRAGFKTRLNIECKPQSLQERKTV